MTGLTPVRQETGRLVYIVPLISEQVGNSWDSQMSVIGSGRGHPRVLGAQARPLIPHTYQCAEGGTIQLWQLTRAGREPASTSGATATR